MRERERERERESFAILILHISSRSFLEISWDCQRPWPRNWALVAYHKIQFSWAHKKTVKQGGLYRNKIQMHLTFHKTQLHMYILNCENEAGNFLAQRIRVNLCSQMEVSSKRFSEHWMSMSPNITFLVTFLHTEEKLFEAWKSFEANLSLHILCTISHQQGQYWMQR
jgi:hypothetical protein